MIVPETAARSDWPRLVAQKTRETDKRVTALEKPLTITFTPTTEPASPAAGMTYFDSGTNKLRTYDGSAWNDLW